MLLAAKMRRIGRISFGLMWLPFSAGMLAMFGMPNGTYDWVELPLLTRYGLAIGGALMIGSTGLLLGALVVSSLAHRNLLARGQPATAKVLSLRETGTTVNRSPLVRLRLEVQPPGQPAFEAETERLISLVEISQFQRGAMVHVKYDPATRAVALLSAAEYEQGVRT